MELPRENHRFRRRGHPRTQWFPTDPSQPEGRKPPPETPTAHSTAEAPALRAAHRHAQTDRPEGQALTPDAEGSPGFREPSACGSGLAPMAQQGVAPAHARPVTTALQGEPGNSRGGRRGRTATQRPPSSGHAPECGERVPAGPPSPPPPGLLTPERPAGGPPPPLLPSCPFRDSPSAAPHADDTKQPAREKGPGSGERGCSGRPGARCLLRLKHP